MSILFVTDNYYKELVYTIHNPVIIKTPALDKLLWCKTNTVHSFHLVHSVFSRNFKTRFSIRGTHNKPSVDDFRKAGSLVIDADAWMAKLPAVPFPAMILQSRSLGIEFISHSKY